MKAVVEEVMGLRRGEGDETERRFLTESENGGAGEKGGDFSLALSTFEAKTYLLLTIVFAPIYKQGGRGEKAVY